MIQPKNVHSRGSRSVCSSSTVYFLHNCLHKAKVNFPFSRVMSEQKRTMNGNACARSSSMWGWEKKEDCVEKAPVANKDYFLCSHVIFCLPETASRKSRKNRIVPIGKQRWCRELIFRMGTFGSEIRDVCSFMQLEILRVWGRKKVALAMRPCERVPSHTSMFTISGIHLRWTARSFVSSLKF